MLMTKERRAAIRSLRGWAISVLQEAGAIQECEEHGWAKESADPKRESEPLRSRRRIPRPASLAKMRSRKFATCWIRSAIPARSVRPSNIGGASAIHGRDVVRL